MGGDDFVELNANSLVAKLGKPPREFRRDDLIGFIASEGIRAVHFRYAGGDGRLKELKLPVNSRRDLEIMLACGERVDGSSLFKGMVIPESSDLYAVPVYRSAFVDPFAPDTLHLVCRFFDSKGNPFDYSPSGALTRAAARMREKTGLELNVLGELEFYLVLEPEKEDHFPCKRQSGYHETAPYMHGCVITDQILRLAAQITAGHVKYCHAEVGVIEGLESEFDRLAGKRLEQHELEFLPAPVEEMADFLVTAQWLIRRVAKQHGAGVTFAPKLQEGAAGTGMHVHVEAVRDGRNVMLDERGSLSRTAKCMIAGLLARARSLMAFGNTVPSAYLRLVPDQEAPTKICWSECNRSALVRVPLGWGHAPDMARAANPQEGGSCVGNDVMQTIELRSPDGSADVYMLLAAICTAVMDGLTAKGSLAEAERLHVRGDFLKESEICARLDGLPQSCHASALALEAERTFYEQDGIFAPEVINFALKRLRDAGDEFLSDELQKMPQDERSTVARRTMHQVALNL